MFDFEQGQQIGEEFSSYQNLPDFNVLMAQKIAEKSSTSAPSGFDPHKIMVKKHKEETGEVPVENTPKSQFPEKDVKALEDFCKQNGIQGFNPGKIHPLAALAMLKQQLGNYEGIPLTERVPFGYEKVGTTNPHNANFPFAAPKTSNKSVIHG